MKEILILLYGSLYSLVVFGQTQSETKRKYTDMEVVIRNYQSLAKKAMDNDNLNLSLSYSDSINNSILNSYLSEGL